MVEGPRKSWWWSGTLSWAVGLTALAAPPATPVINEPLMDGQIVNAADVHMETGPFSDPDPGALHTCTDWEIWTVVPAERIWAALCVGGLGRVHIHLGDGVFEGSHDGLQELLFDTDYRLQARHVDETSTPSAWAERTFITGSATVLFPLELDDVLDTPAPTWRDTVGDDVVLASGSPAAALIVESLNGELLLRVQGDDGVTNTTVNPDALSTHSAARVRVVAGDATVALPDSDLQFVDHEGETVVITLPAVEAVAGAEVAWWVSANGSTYVADPGDTAPDFSDLARGADVPWTVTQPGYRVEVVATGFELPVNIAFVPNPGAAAGDPRYYVAELHGAIKVVTNEGTVSDYATNLLNYTPPPAFPGSGEQGVSGIVVEPTTGDVFVALLYDGGGVNYPRVARLSSLDGGLTANASVTVLDMVGESQGQSHFVSNLSIGPDDHLYVHMGDGFDASTAQNLESFRGKVLRMTLTGAASPTNPFYNAGDGITARDYVYALGVRNPFGGAWRSSDSTHYCVENGPSRDRFSQIVAGRNLLWDGSDASMSALALHVWQPATAPVNIVFVEPETFGGSGFPAEKMDHAFVTESGSTWASGPQGNGKRVTEFVLDAAGNVVSGPTPLIQYSGTGKATAVALAAGPDGLYFSDFYKDQDYSGPTDRGANILRVRFVGTADFEADVVSGDAPLTVQFTDLSTVPGSTAWHWDFGDGATSTALNPQHTYTVDGLYDVQLRVSGAGGLHIAQKNAFVAVGDVPSLAMLVSSVPASAADAAVIAHLEEHGYRVDVYPANPAERPAAATLATTVDGVIVSSTILSSDVGSEFRTVDLPMLYWEQALNTPEREALATSGQTLPDRTALTILDNTHPITAGLPLGAVTVFDAPATMSAANAPFGPDVAVLAEAGGVPGAATILAAEAGDQLVGGHVAPARRVFFFLEDASWLNAASTADVLLDQALDWLVCTPTLYGDVDGSGVVDLFDIVCVIDTFAGALCTTIDLAPCAGDGQVNLDDVLAVLDAFGGRPACAAGCE